MKTAQIFVVIIIFYFLNLIVPSNANAQQVIYSNNFETDEVGSFPKNWILKRNIQWAYPNPPCKYGGRDAKWVIVEDEFGNKKVEIALMGAGCVTEILPDGFTLPDSRNYQLDMDMTFGSTINCHRNILYKYSANGEWDGIKFYNQNIVEFQTARYSDPINVVNSSFPLGFESNKTYHMTIKVINNVVSYSINGTHIYDLQDTYTQLNDGTIGLQASIGPNESTLSNITYFDNIVVTDLSNKILDIPFFSQKDISWKSDTYDSANKWATPETRNIENLGCALSSAAMVLNYHGFTKGPDGQQTNPQTLNQYLKNNHGYNGWGGVVWGAITKYAKLAKTKNQMPADTKLLEFNFAKYNKDRIINRINNSQSSILKLKINSNLNHFITVKGYKFNNQDLIINDPLDLENTNKTLTESYSGKPVIRSVEFTPSSTDLSYLWFFTDPQIEMIIEKDGKQTGTAPNGDIKNDLPNADFFIDGSFGTDSVSSPEYRTLIVEKPESGTYQLTLSSPLSAKVNLEHNLYNEQGDSTEGRTQVFIHKNQPRQFKVKFNKNNLKKTSIQAIGSFKTLNQTLEYVYREKMMNYTSYLHLKHLILLAQNMSERSKPAAKPLLKVVQTAINIFERQKSIKPEGADLLETELNLLLESL